MLNLGELPVENETIDFTHSTNQNLLAHYHKVTINVVSNDNVDGNLPLFMGELKVGHRLKAGQFCSMSLREKRGISCLAYEIPRFSRNDRREIIRFVPL